MLIGKAIAITKAPSPFAFALCNCGVFQDVRPNRVRYTTCHLVEIGRGSPFMHPLESRTSLLAHLGVSERELKKIWWFRDRMYRQITIPKRNGGFRTIHAPDDRLKAIQHLLLLELSKLYAPRVPVHGFVNGKSVKTNATEHLRRPFLLNVDIEDFFGSISEKRVYGLLLALSIPADVVNIISRLVCRGGSLPQGAPTSPLISNMISFRMDRELIRFAKSNRLKYTRYADDITFSSFSPPLAVFLASPPSPGIVGQEVLSKELKSIFERNGFALNKKKIRYAVRSSRRIVTGVKTNELLNVDRRFVRNIRSVMRKLSSDGIAAVQQVFEEKYKSKKDIQSVLKGRIIWIGHLKGEGDPIYRKLVHQFNSVFPQNKITISPSESEKLERAVWIVEGDDDQGTALFTKEKGLITALHCVEQPDLYVYHYTKPSNKFSVTVKAKITHCDIAVLEHEIPEEEYFVLPILSSLPSVTTDVLALGYPGFGPGDQLNRRHGKISSLPIKGGVQLIEVSPQKLNQGMSGGPIVDVGNSVVGVIHKGGPTEDRDFAVSILELLAFDGL